MMTQEQHQERDALALELGPRVLNQLLKTKHIPDPAGWNRIQDLENRINKALGEISGYRALTGSHPTIKPMLNAIESALRNQERQ